MDVGVVRVLPGAKCADQDRLRHAPGQQVAEQLRLERLERHDRRIAGQECPRHVEDVIALADERLERGGDVEHQRGVGHVAEVDDARHVPGPVHQEVVERQVVVDDLRPERRQCRQDPVAEALDHSFQEIATRSCFDQRAVLEQQRQPLLVPQDRPARGGMKEATQRMADARHQLADVAHAGGVQLAWPGVAAGQERKEAHEVMRFTDVCRGDRGSVESGPRHRQRQPGFGQRDPLDGRDLHLHHSGILRSVGDLQDPSGAGGIGQPEVLVALADEWLGGGLDAERGSGDPLRIGGREARWGSFEHVGGCHRRDASGTDVRRALGVHPSFVPVPRTRPALESGTVTAIRPASAFGPCGA